MARRLLVRPEAEADVAEAFAWYEERRSGLGQEFLEEVERCFERIRELPESYVRIYGRYRRALTRRFPYKVFYVVESDYISVIAVLHGARHPSRWRSRL
jgi:plasmid stabilization system protein ParE